MPAMVIRSVGYGAGKRDPDTHANVVRAVVGDGYAGSPAEVAELNAQVDDLPGEAAPPLLDALLAAGALDASVYPITMKKGRPALGIRAICDPAHREAVGQALLRHAGTFGYRWSLQQREVLARRHETVATRFGPIRVKIGEHAGELLHAAPEFEDCRAAAAAAGVPVPEVFRAALAAWSDEGRR